VLARVAGAAAGGRRGHGWLRFGAFGAAIDVEIGPHNDNGDGGDGDGTTRIFGATAAEQASDGSFKTTPGTVAEARAVLESSSFAAADAATAAALAAALPGCGRGGCNGRLVAEASNLRATNAAAGLHGGLPLREQLRRKTTTAAATGSGNDGGGTEDASAGRVLQAGRTGDLHGVGMSVAERSRRAREAAQWEAVSGVSVRNVAAHDTAGDSDDDDDNDESSAGSAIAAAAANASAASQAENAGSSAAAAAGALPFVVRATAAKLQRKRAAVAAAAERCRYALAVQIRCFAKCIRRLRPRLNEHYKSVVN
jgi:hypothetical protein